MKATSLQPLEMKARGTRRSIRWEGKIKPRVGKRTGTTAHFAMWKADLEIKSALQRTKLSKLANAPETPTKAALGYGYLHQGGVKNVWDLLNAKREDLLLISGIGPVRLAAVQADLIAHKAQPKWAVEA